VFSGNLHRQHVYQAMYPGGPNGVNASAARAPQLKLTREMPGWYQMHCCSASCLVLLVQVMPADALGQRALRGSVQELHFR
jgi:hypothetical protein